MTESPKSFEPAAIEAHWGPLWEQSGVYAPSLDPAKASFGVQLPPPNVLSPKNYGYTRWSDLIRATEYFDVDLRENHSYFRTRKANKGVDQIPHIS